MLLSTLSDMIRHANRSAGYSDSGIVEDLCFLKCKFASQVILV